MSDLDSFLAVPQSTHQKRQPTNILKSRTKRTVNNEMEETIKPSSTASTRQATPTSFSKTKLPTQNGDKTVEINLNIQLPSMPPFESAATASNGINDLKELIKKQNHHIQALQTKIDAFEKMDAEKMLEIQKQNYEIQCLKNQTENYLFILDSNSKLWSAVNNLEKQISSNFLKSTNDNHELKHVMEKEIETSKEITFSDIEKYLIENPNRAKDVEKMAKNIREKYEPKKLMVDEFDKKCYRKKMKEERKHYQNETDLDDQDFEKLNKQKNARNWLTSTVDDKLEKYGIRLSSDESVKSVKRSRNVQKSRQRSPSPTYSIISDSSCESDSECSTFSDYSESSDRTIYLTDITQQPDQYIDNWTDDEISLLSKNTSPNIVTAETLDRCVKKFSCPTSPCALEKCLTDITQQPEQCDDNSNSVNDDDENSLSQMSCGETQNDLEEVLSKLKSISTSLEIWKEANNQNSEIISDNDSESINASFVSDYQNKNNWRTDSEYLDSDDENW